jgi:hypothetical protein
VPAVHVKQEAGKGKECNGSDDALSKRPLQLEGEGEVVKRHRVGESVAPKGLPRTLSLTEKLLTSSTLWGKQGNRY